MRKDVKLGFAIGGVLLAVLVVYVLVISGGEKQPRQQVSLAIADKAAPAPAEPAAPEQPATPAEQGPATPATQPAAPRATDPFKVNSADSASHDSAASAADARPAAEDRWDSALMTGRLPAMITQTPEPPVRPALTPTPAPAPAELAVANAPAVAAEADSPAADARSAAQSASNASAFVAPATQPAGPAGAAPRTHIVQVGESFATIAASVYGNAAYYPHLLRANPNLDPRRLKPGMTINLPEVGEVRADGSGPAAGAAARSARPAGGPQASAATAIDEKTQYRVQARDSLYKISVRLYGKADHVDRIYELNKDAIGPNPANLKVGMILKLPDPPTLASR